MNDKQKAASEILEMLNYPLPHSEGDCQKVIDYRAKYFVENEILSVEAAQYRAEHGSLGFFAGIQEVANELKANRK